MSAASSEAPKGPPKITIDGVQVEFRPGDTIMRAAERVNLAGTIPRYCYHPGLPIAGTCRMCIVEIEKSPKLMTSCSTPATDGMIIHTNNDRVRKSHQGVMEFLLLNHPLDCPVCDQAGECSLQDYDYEYGPGTSRYDEEKRVWSQATTKKLSEEITLNMNRCIHCERCVRFTDAITQSNELLMINRGWKKELTTAGNKGLFNDYQGCLADICPVGALTFNDFRFKKRVWFLKSAPTICDGCSKGCNISADHEKNIVHRYRPIFNEKVNGHWMCDEGRKSYHTYMDETRVIYPLLKSQQAKGELSSTTWETLSQVVTQELGIAKTVMVVMGTDCTTEEATQLKSDFTKLTRAEVTFRYWNGVNGVETSKQDEPLDPLLRRKDKTPNTKGLEGLGLKPFQPKTDNQADLGILIRHGRASIPQSPMAKKNILWGVFSQSEIKAAHWLALIPGVSTLEKAGSFTSCDSITQTFKAAVKHLGEGLPVATVLKQLSESMKPTRTGLIAKAQNL